MENFNQIESEILNKIKNVLKIKKLLRKLKLKFLEKRGIITELFKKIGNLDQG